MNTVKIRVEETAAESLGPKVQVLLNSLEQAATCLREARRTRERDLRALRAAARDMLRCDSAGRPTRQALWIYDQVLRCVERQLEPLHSTVQRQADELLRHVEDERAQLTRSFRESDRRQLPSLRDQRRRVQDLLCYLDLALEPPDCPPARPSVG